MSCMAFIPVAHGQIVSNQSDDLTAGNAITLELIMSDQDWLGRRPENAYWGDMGKYVYYSRKRPGSPVRDLYRGSTTGDDPNQLVSPKDVANQSVKGGYWRYDSADQLFTEKVYVRAGDVYHRDLKTGSIRQLTRTSSMESQPLLLTDGSVGFRRGDTFLVRDLETGLEYEPFPYVFDKDPSNRKLDEEKEKTLLARQQYRLFETIQSKENDAVLQEEEQQLAEKEDPSRTGTPFYLGDESELGIVRMSPSGRHLAMVLLPKNRPKNPQTSMPSWVTSSGDIENRDVRSKVGGVKPFHSRLMILNRETREVVDVELDSLPDIAKDPLDSLKLKAKQREESRIKELQQKSGSNDHSPSKDSTQSDEKGESDKLASETHSETKGKSRPLQFQSISFNHDGSSMIFQAVSFDHKDRWLVSVDLESGHCHTLHHLHESAWINWRHNEYGWSRDGTQVWFNLKKPGTHICIWWMFQQRTLRMTLSPSQQR